MKNKFAYLVGFSALSLVSAAAFFSVSGLAKLFSGASFAVMIMASSLELAKVITTSFLYQYWKDVSKVMKVYMVTGVIILMIITSAGIYGFLSNAYSITSGKVNEVDGKIELINQRKEIFKTQTDRTKEIIDNKSKRINSLSTLRAQQENRIDSLYRRGWSTSARKTEQIIREAGNDITKLNKEIDSLNLKNQNIYDTISKLDTKILETKNSDVKSEVGALRYIADLTGKDMDTVANFFILLFVFVFDPLALCLIIATNLIIVKSRNKTEVDESEPITELFKFKKKKDEKSVEKIDFVELKNEEIVDEIEKEIIEEDDSKIVYPFKAEEPVAPEIEEEIINTPEVNEETPAVIKAVEYVSNEEGEFKPKEQTIEAIEAIEAIEVVDEKESENTPEAVIALIEKEKKTKYLEFLSALFKDGKVQKNDKLAAYKELVKILQDRNIKFEENELKDFLTVCIMIKAMHVIDDEGAIADKDYIETRYIISMM